MNENSDFSKLCPFVNFEQKVSFARGLFKELYQASFELYPCECKHYRTRVELSFYHSNEGLCYAMFENKKKIKVQNLDFVDKKISALMPVLLQELNSKEKLKQKLFGVEFLATKEDLSVTLLYHKDIELIQKDLAQLSLNLDLNVIARSKNKKLIFKNENLRQVLNIGNKTIYYELSNDCFIQPNTSINEKMIEWTLKILQSQERKDLLELYCGYGNFTLALAPFFRKVLASEISKSSIYFALKNCHLNAVSNIDFVRLSSEELYTALTKKREFFRLRNINLDEFDFSHIFIDPPRSGLDESVKTFIQNYDTILYISCNPLSLKKDLQKLTQTHKIIHFAFFDQFQNTRHLECGVLLSKV